MELHWNLNEIMDWFSETGEELLGHIEKILKKFAKVDMSGNWKDPNTVFSFQGYK